MGIGLNKYESFSLISRPAHTHQGKQRSNQILGPGAFRSQAPSPVVGRPGSGSHSSGADSPLLRGMEQKPTFHDTCSNPGWNVSEKMQEKFLKYISLQPQYIPYACRGPGREPDVLRYLWKMFLSHTGESLSRGSPT